METMKKGVMILMISAALLVPGIAGTSVVSEFQITMDTSIQTRPAIYGNVVVWMDDRNGNWDIYGYNISKRKEISICTAGGDQERPAIYGNIVVWHDGRNGDYDIYGYDLFTSTEFPICTQGSDQLWPAIYKNIVAWADLRNGNRDIYGYDLSTSTEFPIRVIPHDQYDPAIYENIVMFEDKRNGNPDMYGYDLSTFTEFPICLNPGPQYDAKIFGNTAIWMDWRNGNRDIYGYDLPTFTEFPICTLSSSQEDPAIQGNVVVWVDTRNGNHDIYGHDLSSSTEFPICTNGSGQYNPAIYGNVVVWEDCRNGNKDLYYSRLDMNVPRPDLTLSPDDVILSTSNPKVGETITITATIENIGDTEADAVEVFFYNKFADIGKLTVHSIEAGEDQTVEIEWNWTLNAGSSDICVIVDDYDLIEEKNEENNFVCKTITISCAPDNQNYLHTPELKEEKKALRLVPYHDYHKGNFVGYSENLRDKLEDIGFRVDYFKNEEVSITELDELLDDENYWIIHITSHGTEDFVAIERFENEKKGKERWEELRDKYEDYGENFDNMFLFKENDPKIGTYIGITGDFISARCSGLPQHPLVFFESCRMGNNEAMRDAFICKGAGAYVGFNNDVINGSSVLYRTVGKVSEDFYSKLIDNGFTVKKAVDNTDPGDIFGCLVPNTCRNAKLVSYGNDEYLVLAEPGSTTTTPTTGPTANEMMKPLSSTRIAQAESLKEEAFVLLQEAIEKGIDISEAQAMIEKADKFLIDAKKSFSSGNYIAANTLALEAIGLYQQAIETLETLLGS